MNFGYGKYIFCIFFLILKVKDLMRKLIFVVWLFGGWVDCFLIMIIVLGEMLMFVFEFVEIFKDVNMCNIC